MQSKKSNILNSITQIFLRGILVLAPIGITIWLLVWIFQILAGIIPGIHPALSFGIVIGTVFLVGLVMSKFRMSDFIMSSMDSVFNRTPFIKLIYSSIKDLVGSFVGDKKKFDKTVLVKTSNDPEMWRIGFITDKDATHLGLEDRVAVYIPHSFAWSGNLWIVESKNIKIVPHMKSSDALKYIVTGGSVNSKEKDNEA